MPEYWSGWLQGLLLAFIWQQEACWQCKFHRLQWMPRSLSGSAKPFFFLASNFTFKFQDLDFQHNGDNAYWLNFMCSLPQSPPLKMYISSGREHPLHCPYLIPRTSLLGPVCLPQPAGVKVTWDWNQDSRPQGGYEKEKGTEKVKRWKMAAQVRVYLPCKACPNGSPE